MTQTAPAWAFQGRREFRSRSAKGIERACPEESSPLDWGRLPVRMAIGNRFPLSSVGDRRPMELRLFTAEQASALIPYLEAKVKRIRATKRELDATARRLEVLSLIAGTGATGENPDVRARERTEARARHLAREIEEEVEAIQGRGCVVKDLDGGLVDFYALRGDRLVFLCWKSGEEEVAHWHPLDRGYAARKPLETHET
jgi:hypothetical protein